MLDQHAGGCRRDQPGECGEGNAQSEKRPTRVGRSRIGQEGDREREADALVLACSDATRKRFLIYKTWRAECKQAEKGSSNEIV